MIVYAAAAASSHGMRALLHSRHMAIAPEMAKSANNVPVISWKSCRAAFQNTRRTVIADRHAAAIQSTPITPF